jgi:AraC-like DNA-binding protein
MKRPPLGPPPAHIVWPPPSVELPGDLIYPAVDEVFVAYYRPTPKPFYFLHSSHLPPGSSIPLHRHPCVALHGCLQGPLTMLTADGPQLLETPGTFYLIGPDVPHGWRCDGPHTAANLSVLIDHRHLGAWPAASGVPECIRELARRVIGLHRFHAASDPVVKFAFWEVVDHLMTERPRKPAATTGLLLTLVGRLLECLDADADAPATQTDAAEQIRRLLMARIEDRLSIEEVARAVRLSPTRAKQVFRAAYGCGIMAYFNQLKIWQAKRLLSASSLTVDQVSRKLRFSSPSYFSRVFQRCTGESPSDYRQQRGQNL